MSNNNKENERVVKSSGLPLASLLLAVIAARSLSQLFLLPTEIPGVFLAGGGAAAAPSVDWIGTIFDVFFVGYGLQTLLRQSGILGSTAAAAKDGAASSVVRSLANLECRATLDVGRERGTWMGKEWAASGARLLLPVRVKFSEEEIDLGFPGEESLGGRFCRRLEVLDERGEATFVDLRGEVRVKVLGGGWTVLPSNKGSNELKLRFFLDLPDGATRNDVNVPAGTRVFFGGVCFQESDVHDVVLGARESLLRGPDGVAILANGGLTMTKNGIANLYGAMGDTNIMLGRFKLSGIVGSPSDSSYY